jgi:phosphoglycolate phosphatase-like HAD superfamily hydrolase
MFKDIELIIYDLDGTLIDCTDNIVASFRRIWEEIGEPFDPEEIKSRIGVGLVEILLELLPEVYHGDVMIFRQKYIDNFMSLGTDHIRLLPNVMETMKELNRRGFKQSIATNKTASEAVRILEALGLGGFIDLYAGYGTVPNVKPAPDMILYNLEELGVSNKKAVFVDDSKVGLTAGIRAEVHTVGITTGTNSEDQIRETGPDVIIHDLFELTSLLE